MTGKSKKEIQGPDKFSEMVGSMFELINIFSKVLFSKNDLSNKMKLTPTQFEIIFALHKTGSTTSSEISKLLRINKSNLSSQIDTLVKMNLINRQNGEVDRRKIFLSLTEEGWKIIRGLFKASSEIAREKMPSITEEEINRINDCFLDILRVFKTRIEH